ncbi:phage tail assembly protein [Ralstonia syzygii subsp. celebesensis]|uniref:phage tail assembly protein n=1 Tax=Ralstonia syzygii TaxID=28097 RepID=UPI00387E0B06
MAKLPLKYPLPIGKTTISHLTFRDHTIAEDYLSFDKRGGVAQRIALIASLTGTDEELVKKLRGVDYRRAEKMADTIIEADEEAEEPTAESSETPPEDEATAAARKSSARAARCGIGGARAAPVAARRQSHATARAVHLGEDRSRDGRQEIRVARQSW